MMSLRIVRILLALLAMATLALASDTPETNQDSAEVQVYLPRERTVPAGTMTLDRVAHVTGTDTDLVARAVAVKLGRAPFPGETIVLDRETIASRLAAEGIKPDHVQITGAEKVSLLRDASTLRGEDFVAAAESFLKAHPTARRIVLKLSRSPQKMVLDGSPKIELACSLAQDAPHGYVDVIVSVLHDGRELDSRTVRYQQYYRIQQVVATAEIAPGDVIGQHNATIQTVEVHRKPPDRWVSPFGGTANIRIHRDAVIRPAMVTLPEDRIVVKRNDEVLIKVEGNGWRITVQGVAKQDGRAGDTVRVMNMDTRKIIVGRVDEDGDIVPLMSDTQRGGR